MWPSYGTAQATNFDELKHCCIKTLFPPLFSRKDPACQEARRSPGAQLETLYQVWNAGSTKLSPGTYLLSISKSYMFVSNLQFCRQASVLPEQWDFFLFHFRNAPLPLPSIWGSRVAVQAGLCGQRALPTAAGACPGHGSTVPWQRVS